MTTLRDVIVVGGGYRTVSFLAAQPHLLRWDIEVLEMTETFGAGAFADYHCLSTSTARRFLRDVAPEIAAATADPVRLARLSRMEQPIALSALAEVMADLGGVVEQQLSPHGRVRRGCTVTELRVRADRVEMLLSTGEATAARHALVATGRAERPHPELTPWRHKTVVSGEVISVRHTAQTCARLARATGPVVVVGGSHSAMAAVLRLLELRRSTGREDLPVVMVRRSPARLHYASLAQAHAGRDGRYESAIDPIADVCPETGQVNRDSGLRGDSKALLRALASGAVPHARMQRAETIDDCSELLDSASFVVQALGYRGRAPALSLPDGTRRPPDSAEPLVNLADGTAVIGARPLDRVSVLRVEPTPRVLRDHGRYGQGMYLRLAQRLDAALGVVSRAS